MIPPLQGLLLFGSRIDPFKAPRNTKENTSDIDYSPVIYENDELSGSWEKLLQMYIISHLQKQSRFNNIPIENHGPITPLKFYGYLTVNQSDVGKFSGKTLLSTNPKGIVYVGNLCINGRHYPGQEINLMLMKTLSSDILRQFRQREIEKKSNKPLLTSCLSCI